MKKMLAAIVLAVFIPSLSFAFGGEFCEGYKAGYATGYKERNRSNINPIPPICPIKPIKGFGDPKSDYEFGYTQGYKKGLTGR